ncbi:hypothetical protein LXL04_021634 [Taraxacum kok-saghyz]
MEGIEIRRSSLFHTPDRHLLLRFHTTSIDDSDFTQPPSALPLIPPSIDPASIDDSDFTQPPSALLFKLHSLVISFSDFTQPPSTTPISHSLHLLFKTREIVLVRRLICFFCKLQLLIRSLYLNPRVSSTLN